MLADRPSTGGTDRGAKQLTLSRSPWIFYFFLDIGIPRKPSFFFATPHFLLPILICILVLYSTFDSTLVVLSPFILVQLFMYYFYCFLLLSPSTFTFLFTVLLRRLKQVFIDHPPAAHIAAKSKHHGV